MDARGGVALEMEVPQPCPMEGPPTSRTIARVKLSVLPIVNASGVDVIVVSGRNGMLRSKTHPPYDSLHSSCS